jgi:ABC-type glycerol-3-phosphate transport system substrate-binding protein
MKTIVKLLGVLVLGAAALNAAEAAKKNWTPPAHKIYAQVLSDEIMAANPDLISITFHGVPPGMSKVYTMFAGSYLDRIGNIDDPDDVMVIELGITILDPRWHRRADPAKKFVLLMPLRDASGENIGLLVPAYKNPDFKPDGSNSKLEMEYFKKAAKLRDDLQKKIPSYDALFAPAK